MKWRSIHFGWPEAALLLFVALLLMMAFTMLYRYRKAKLAAMADHRILNTIEEPRSAILFWIKSFFFCTAWFFGVLALMDPKGNQRYPLTSEENAENKSVPHQAREVSQDIFFLVDASASMAATDARSGNTRLDEAKEIADELISRLRGQNVTLFAFTSDAMQLVPLTTDYLFTRLMLRQLAINEGETSGTDILQALTSIQSAISNSSLQKKTALIMLTDGEDTVLEGIKGDDQEKYIQKINDAIHTPNSKQLNVYIVGLGSKQGKEVPGVTFQGHAVISIPNEGLLKGISHAAGGDFFLSREKTSLQIADAILEGLKANQQFQNRIVSQPFEGKNQNELIYDRYFQIPLGMGIIALALALLLPETLRRLS